MISSRPAQLTFGGERSAVFSKDRHYRYSLRRRLGDGPAVLFVGLNPSTADEFQDDNTVRRCVGYARDWGFGTLFVANVYALCSTDRKGLWRDPEPVGSRTWNDVFIQSLARGSQLVVAAWGSDPGPDRRRPERVFSLLGDCVALGVTKSGEPRHPLYVRGDVEPFPYQRAA